MKLENKYSVMFWAIVVLAVMNITTILTVVYSRYQAVESVALVGTSEQQTEEEAEKFSGRYFRDQLNLSSEQMQQFKEINPVFRPKARSITIELAEKRRMMLVEMAAAKSDTARLNELSDSIGQLHSDLKRFTYQYYLEIKAICDQEQQKKLVQIFGEMFATDSPLGSSGKGGQRGWQQGRRFSN